MRLLKNPLFYLPLLFVVILIFYFGDLFLHPNLYVFNQWGDGIKNYFTPAWYIEYDTGIHFSGMNYPFGDHIVYTDNQPVISLLLNFIDDNLFRVSAYTVGILNTLMFLSFIFCAVFVYKILREYGLRQGYAFFAALIITCMNPQTVRLEGHYALSYSFFIPLLWWLHIVLQKRPSVLNISVLICVITFAGLTHLYYLLTASLFLIGYIIYRLVTKSSSLREVLVHISLIGIPFAIIFTWLAFTDPASDRTHVPYGFFHYKASLQSVLLPEKGGVTRFFYNRLHVRPANYEGFAYIGFAAVVVLLVSACGYIRCAVRSRSLRAPSLLTSEKMAPYFVAGIMALLFSMALPFSLGLQKLLDILPLIKQFRSPGRFAWIFYFEMQVYAAGVLYRWYLLLKTKKEWLCCSLRPFFRGCCPFREQCSPCK